jgi:hypothetical protein
MPVAPEQTSTSGACGGSIVVGGVAVVVIVVAGNVAVVVVAVAVVAVAVVEVGCPPNTTMENGDSGHCDNGSDHDDRPIPIQWWLFWLAIRHVNSRAEAARLSWTFVASTERAS